MSDQKIPDTDSINELAQFWDRHDITDFEDQLEEVNETVFERETVLNIHLNNEDANIVRRLAKSKGISYVDLIHGWIKERIHAI